MLTEKHKEIIEYLVTGTYTIAEISKLTGVSDRQIYRYRNDDEFKAECQRRTEEYNSLLKKEVTSKISSKLHMAIDNIIEMANKSNSEKVKLEANQWLYEIIAGKPTAKLEDVTTDDNNKSSELSWEDVKKLDNVIELDKKVK